MPTTTLPSALRNPALLLAEAAASGYSERVAQLDKLRFCVTKASNVSETCLMRRVFMYSVEMLSNMVGLLAFRESAQTVRGLKARCYAERK